MGEREGGESRSVGAFLVGFLLGVLVTLGGAGTFFMVAQRGELMRAREAMAQAEAARAEAERAREMAERARQAEERTRRAQGEAKKQAGKNGDKGKAALAGVRTLESAVKAYKITYGDHPESLEVLTKADGDKPAVLEERALTDPWGRPYVYDPAHKNELTGVPLIYSQGPNPADEKGHIRNWK